MNDMEMKKSKYVLRSQLEFMFIKIRLSGYTIENSGYSIGFHKLPKQSNSFAFNELIPDGTIPLVKIKYIQFILPKMWLTTVNADRIEYSVIPNSSIENTNDVETIEITMEDFSNYLFESRTNEYDGLFHPIIQILDVSRTYCKLLNSAKRPIGFMINNI